MSAIAALVFANVLFAGTTVPVRAPVPPDTLPDPLARGYLGISIGHETVTVERVETATPAAKAGLQAGDVLVRVGTEPARTTEQVISHICSFRPGSVVEIEVQRGAERKTFKVKLGCRPEALDHPITYPIEDFIPAP
jgi:S1-C subfamily serine protease